MFLALLFLATSLLTGYALVRHLPLTWYKSELVFASIAVGLFAGTWILFLSSWAAGYTAGYWLCLTILGGFCVFMHVRQKKLALPSEFYHEKTHWIWLSVALTSLCLFTWLFYTHMLQVKNDAYFSGGSTWGDLALHLALATGFAQQPHFTWEFPLFSGAKLSYPLLIDFLSGMLYRFGLNLQTAMFIPGILLTLSLVQLIYFFVLRITKSSGAAALTLILFLGSGGAVGISIFWQDWLTSNLSLFSFLGSMTKQYTNLWSNGIYFSNIINDYLLPQRGILFGLSLFALTSTILHNAWQKKESSQKMLGSAALLIGFLPLAHTHTFFVLWGMLVFLAACRAYIDKTIFTPWTQAVFIASMVAAPQIIWQMGSNFSRDFSHFQFGWMKKPDENIILFWLRNMGLPFIFFFTNFWLIKRLTTKNSWHLAFYTPLVILFLITNIYQFQPHSYDNMKFMVYSYLGICIYMGYSLWLLSTYKPGGRMLATLLIVITCASGFLAVLRETYVSWQFSSTQEIAATEQFKSITPPDAVTLTSDQHNHFVPTLTGRPIIMGYRGWLWTYGINYTAVEQDVRAMLTGAPATPSLLKRYNVSFVVISPSERNDYNANQAYYDRHATLVMDTGPIRVYDVRAFSLQ